MKNIQHSLVVVALLNLILPLKAWAGNPLPIQEARRANADIRLRQDNSLRGQLVDVTGQPISGISVAMYAQGNLVGTAVSDTQGSFSLVTHHGGVYELRAGDQVQIVRLWHHATSPPSAKSTLQLKINAETVRGQRPIESLFCFQPWFLGVVIAAAIAIPLAVDNSDSRRPGS
jgi:hypothetical protein